MYYQMIQGEAVESYSNSIERVCPKLGEAFIVVCISTEHHDEAVRRIQDALSRPTLAEILEEDGHNPQPIRAVPRDPCDSCKVIAAMQEHIKDLRYAQVTNHRPPDEHLALMASCGQRIKQKAQEADPDRYISTQEIWDQVRSPEFQKIMDDYWALVFEEDGCETSPDPMPMPPGRWRAEDGGVFFIVSSTGKVIQERETNETKDYTDPFWETGNYFRGRCLAQAAAARIRNARAVYHQEIME